jgi:hypothetical protein
MRLLRTAVLLIVCVTIAFAQNGSERTYTNNDLATLRALPKQRGVDMGRSARPDNTHECCRFRQVRSDEDFD